MFNALGNIFSIKPRQAEQTDTRQDIRRHDPDYENPRKKKEAEENQSFNEDQATVSVEALKLFLENFVKNATDSGEQQQDSEQSDGITEQSPLDFKIQTEMPLETGTKAPLKSGKAAHGAAAYAQMAEANERRDILFETTDQAEGPPLELSATDIRSIYAIIEDLKILSEAHIEYLHIERASTFLESLENAVRTQKAALIQQS